MNQSLLHVALVVRDYDEAIRQSGGAWVETAPMPGLTMVVADYCNGGRRLVLPTARTAVFSSERVPMPKPQAVHRPTVSREQAVAALEQAKDALLGRANPSV